MTFDHLPYSEVNFDDAFKSLMTWEHKWRSH